jgi:hypothetical protein
MKRVFAIGSGSVQQNNSPSKGRGSWKGPGKKKGLLHPMKKPFIDGAEGGT